MSKYAAGNYPSHLCLHELFEQQVERTPGAIACAYGEEELTYGELNSQANQVGQYLRSRGAAPGQRVGIFVERSVAMLVALLGIQKSGAAYVPLDPEYPAERIRMTLADAKAALLVTQRPLLGKLPTHSAETVCLDAKSENIAGQHRTNPVSGVSPEDLLYIIFTSGSTGRPKGVQITHRNVVNLITSMQFEPGLSAEDTLLAVTTLSFDIAGLELYLPLVTGARVSIASRDQSRDGRQLIKELERTKATVMQATPATWRLLLEAGWKGTPRVKALCGGEALPRELAAQLVPQCSELWNMYGPTETTIWSSIYKVESAADGPIPIGMPIANTTMYVVGENGLQLPAGVPGELYIGGDGVAAGYLDRADLTAEKFVADPVLRGKKAYRTGDVVKLLPDGNFLYLGRSDHQVKWQGFRIELGEIETVLDRHPEVAQSVVVLREDNRGESRLVGYLTASGEESPKSAELRAWLKERLPEYMVPVALVSLARFPLTPNGKIDRKSLPEPRPEDFRTKQEYTAPRDNVERKLVALWEEVLDIRPLGISDNFFDLGGRSILAARLFVKISRTFGRELPLSALIDAPTVKQLANKLRPSAKTESYPTLVPMRSGSRPPFFCVHGGAGSTLFLQRLARELNADQPFYGIEPEGLDGGRFERPTIEQMATHYLAEIRKVQPAGPYHFGGYCFGGIVAFEMAQQLLRQGEKASLVVLFTAPLRFHRLIPERKPDHSMANLKRMRPAQLFALARRAFRWRWARLRNTAVARTAMSTYRLLFRVGFKVPPAMRTMYVVRMLSIAERTYVPTPYPGTLVLFHGEGMEEGGPNQGWDGLAERFDHRVIGEGGKRLRRDLMYEPLVGITARELTGCIDNTVQEEHEKSPACP